MWRFSIATKQQIAGFPTISDKVIFPTVVKPLISNKNVQNRPESEQFREMLGVFLFSKANPQTRRGQGGDVDAPYAEISQERMSVLSWRLRAEEI
jgi:hypothetical protein